jgi:hypothetical protein
MDDGQGMRQASSPPGTRAYNTKRPCRAEPFYIIRHAPALFRHKSGGVLSVGFNRPFQSEFEQFVLDCFDRFSDGRRFTDIFFNLFYHFIHK